jgi:hypothetical protein
MNDKSHYLQARAVFYIVCGVIIVTSIYKAVYYPHPLIPAVTRTSQALVPQNATPVQSPSPSKQPANSIPQREATETLPPAHPKPALKLTPIEPSSGLSSDASMTIQQCRHDGDSVQCWGYVSISTDIPTQECFHWSDATDDLGNVFRQWSSPQFSGDGQINTLIPNTRYRFELVVADPHPAVQTMSFIIYFVSNCNRIGVRSQENYVVFTNVPVQK